MVRTPTKILLVCLLILMWFPMAEMNLCIFKEYEYSENRELAKEPELKAELSALRRFPKDCESFIGDHLGFRCSLIRLNNILRVNLLGVSPVPSVVMGRDSWLFYRSEVFPDGFTFNDHCGLIPLSETELDALRERIEWNHELFSRNGIFYIVVIVPNKNTIYGEFLPESIVRNGNPTRLEQFSEYMRNHSRVKVMDLRRALLNAKKLHPIYYKTDSHWNDFGAYTGYREIIEELSRVFPGVRPISIENEKVSVRRTSPGGDLAQMLLMDDLIDEDLSTAFEIQPDTGGRKLAKLFFRHDSFGDGLYRYFYPHFQKVVGAAPFVPFNYDRILAERPEVVLHVFAERYITLALHDDFFYEGAP
ncbi:alginate O-acetyltransferase AlgX-related protein [Syntrophobacter fumaroxidans]|uniref:Alginate O-acetyltransferase AlgJ n=1 Tax=Syntrophobacter fumaroxidans (strain DSM 10017 / MPOB) TaxID=335543 RepID=A0LHC1_SYNFM|nr:alginate O-acetyltransferase AlgJ [Syntrophobacter fumaroxidans]ABK16823.1 alginate O-acetyltransferase AlgJ [Syntrophobacter fumaroxidans MPOB]